MTCPVSHQRTEWIDHFTGICSQLTWVLPAKRQGWEWSMDEKCGFGPSDTSKVITNTSPFPAPLHGIAKGRSIHLPAEIQPRQSLNLRTKTSAEIPETVSKGKNCKHNGFFGSQSQPFPDILMVQESVFISSMIFLSGMLSHNRIRIGWQRSLL